jgi:hypothetical protein
MLTFTQLRYLIAKTPARSLVVWLRHMGLKPDDVYLAAYPRSGSTWATFILYEILSGQPAEFRDVMTAIPHIGSHYKAIPLLPGGNRLLKNHEPYRSIYKRAIYLVRDVRDVALSEYNHRKWHGTESGDFDDFLVRFLNGKTHGFGFGSWANHGNSWLDACPVLGKDILVIKFEDMRQNPEEIVAEMADFFGVKVDKQTIRSAIDNNTIEKMRKKEDKFRRTSSPGRSSHMLFRVFEARQLKDKLTNYSDNHRLIRKGSTGGWQQTLTDEQVQLIHQHTRETLIRLGYPT